MLKGFQSAVNLRKWDLGRCPTLLAVSGGADSVALARLFALSGWPFAIAHVNFGLRGAESMGDEAFVRALGEELGVDVFVETVDLSGYRKQNGMSVQMAARELRYAFFYRLMKERGFCKLATAHHANDNLEHFFLYLYRNNLAVAMRGIWMEQGDVIRPLLGFTKQALKSFLETGGWQWREDRSNAETGYLRNKIRHYLLPGMDDFALEFFGLCEQQQRLKKGEEDQEAALWNAHCRETRQGWWMPLAYRELVKSEGLYARLMGLGFSHSMVDQALHASQVGKYFDGTAQRLWVGRRGWMITPKSLNSPAAKVFEWRDGAEMVWGGYRLVLKKLEDKSNLTSWLNDPETYVFGMGVEKKNWVLRGWVNGDVLTGWGGVEKKVSDWFVDEKVELFVKPFVPLLVGGEGVLCAVGVRRSNLYPTGSEMGSFWALRWEVF